MKIQQVSKKQSQFFHKKYIESGRPSSCSNVICSIFFIFRRCFVSRFCNHKVQAKKIKVRKFGVDRLKTAGTTQDKTP